MKIYGITHDLNLAVGLKLAGIEAINLEERQDVLKKVEEIKLKKDIGILVITEEIYNISKEEFDILKQNTKLPLLVKIPNSERSL